METRNCKNKSQFVKPSMYSRAPAPIRGKDYIYGYAVVPATWGGTDADKALDYPKGKIQGWALPGGKFTSNNGVVQDMARRIDQLIRQSGGLPKNWIAAAGVSRESVQD